VAQCFYLGDKEYDLPLKFSFWCFLNEVLKVIVFFVQVFSALLFTFWPQSTHSGSSFVQHLGFSILAILAFIFLFQLFLLISAFTFIFGF
jgi:hypothetical protein